MYDNELGEYDRLEKLMLMHVAAARIAIEEYSLIQCMEPSSVLISSLIFLFLLEKGEYELIERFDFRDTAPYEGAPLDVIWSLFVWNNDQAAVFLVDPPEDLIKEYILFLNNIPYKKKDEYIIKEAKIRYNILKKML